MLIKNLNTKEGSANSCEHAMVTTMMNGLYISANSTASLSADHYYKVN